MCPHSVRMQHATGQLFLCEYVKGCRCFAALLGTAWSLLVRRHALVHAASERASWDAPLRAARLNRCKATATGTALGLAGWHRAALEQGAPSQARLVWPEITACSVRGALWQSLNDAVWGCFSSQH